ncbi:sugar ABC transporter permease protein [Microbacterium sp. TS-1]|jgi:multiple sugar transport system permease protein|uniref:Amino acid ABC transporter permease n=1 Tax=Microbacterium arborescens TaxID=33883 RepID=A0ABX2WKK7_9MICO|nr:MULTISPECIES: sugar ABC transporter permease [Microbacterium]APF35213.1 amino acid ABC transporter permease [Microbacterium paludicola]OAZ43779.1 amino acid ABC transporter permease [Microbacterium arborescens]POX65624.1 sugar ABC transporter permease [Microbacterium sp. Ru50]QCR41232.1 sugar ABC transporter permease [Microbacterium sp. SGAir0570]GAD35783.1 sugar ABC transporter permease protein [Microbacterium sp. TS-1]
MTATATVTTGGRHRPGRDITSRSGRSAGRAAARLLPLLPAVLLLLAFMLGPIVYALYGSLTDRAMTGPRAANPQFIGLDNYTALFASGEFWLSLGLTVVFVLASAVIGQNVLGMLLAVLIRSSVKPLRSIVGGLVVLAWVLPEIVAAFALYAFFQTDGTLNTFLGWFGLEGTSWLYYFPMLAVILANIWRGTAFSMMVYNAALSEVPPELIEAATIDGAGAWQRFIRVTLPVIRRSISTNLLLTTLQTLGVFTLIWVMTGGGPGTQSSTLPVLAFQEAFKFAQVGYGTAIAVVTLLIGAVFSAVYIRILKPEVD